MKLQVSELACHCCGLSLPSGDLRGHIEKTHLMGWRNYYQLVKAAGDLDKNRTCWECGAKRPLLSPLIHDDYILPCPKCGSREEIMAVVEKFVGRGISDKYFQEIICSPTWIPRTLKYSFKILKEFLKSGDPDYSKKSRITIDFKPWAPQEISMRNSEGLIIKRYHDIPKPVSTESGQCFQYTLPDSKKVIQVRLPEVIPFDFRHHSRYSIFNTKEYTRKTKRLKFTNSQDCIKFWNTGVKDYKGILRLEDQDGNPLRLSDFTEPEQKLIKLSILRTRPILDILQKVYLELSRFSKSLKDYVFAWNDIPLYQKNVTSCVLVWDSDESKYEDALINISIL